MIGKPLPRDRGVNATPDDVGRRVMYWPEHLEQPEFGVITAVGSRYVFVRFGEELHSKACEPRDLIWCEWSMRRLAQAIDAAFSGLSEATKGD